jgi:hypothetical protein
MSYSKISSLLKFNSSVDAILFILNFSTDLYSLYNCIDFIDMPDKKNLQQTKPIHT